MPAPRRHPARPVAAAAALLLLAAGCGPSDGGSDPGPAASSTGGVSDAAGSGSAGGPSAQGSPRGVGTSAPASGGGGSTAQSGAGTVCSTDAHTKVVVNKGPADCAQATRVIAATPGMGVEAPPDIEGWKCGRVGGQGGPEGAGYSYRCDKGGAQVVKQALETTTAENWELDFPTGTGGGYFFSSPSGKWRCGMRSTGTMGAGQAAGCHGPFPSSLKDDEGIAKGLAVDTASVTSTGEPGTFHTSTNPEWLDYRDGEIVQHPKALEYGSALYYNAMLCRSTQQGMTCETGGHGFTASTNDPKVW